MKTITNLAIVLCSTFIVTQSSAATTRYVSLGFSPQINSKSTEVVKREDSRQVHPAPDYQCIADEGRIVIALAGGAYWTRDLDQGTGVLTRLDGIQATFFSANYYVRGDSSLFDKLTPVSEFYLRSEIGSRWFHVRPTGSLPGYVQEIPFDGLPLANPHVNVLGNLTTSEMFRVVNDANGRFYNPYDRGQTRMQQVDTKHGRARWYVPTDYDLDRNYADLNDFSRFFSGYFVLKLDASSGYVKGVGGFYKRYLHYVDDLNGKTVTPADTPKPIFTAECRIVQVAKPRSN